MDDLLESYMGIRDLDLGKTYSIIFLSVRSQSHRLVQAIVVSCTRATFGHWGKLCIPQTGDAVAE